jgi:hypothetical protein
MNADGSHKDQITRGAPGRAGAHRRTADLDQFRNGFPSVEDATSAPTRLTDPDWYPIMP